MREQIERILLDLLRCRIDKNDAADMLEDLKLKGVRDVLPEFMFKDPDGDIRVDSAWVVGCDLTEAWEEYLNKITE